MERKEQKEFISDQIGEELLKILKEKWNARKYNVNTKHEKMSKKQYK